jgi:hypothetical protein
MNFKFYLECLALSFTRPVLPSTPPPTSLLRYRYHIKMRNCPNYIRYPIVCTTRQLSVADPYYFDPEPGHAFHFDADPDPTFHSDLYPDPKFQFDSDLDLTTHFFPDMDPQCSIMAL